MKIKFLKIALLCTIFSTLYFNVKANNPTAGKYYKFDVKKSALAGWKATAEQNATNKNLENFVTKMTTENWKVKKITLNDNEKITTLPYKLLDILDDKGKISLLSSKFIKGKTSINVYTDWEDKITNKTGTNKKMFEGISTLTDSDPIKFTLDAPTEGEEAEGEEEEVPTENEPIIKTFNSDDSDYDEKFADFINKMVAAEAKTDQKEQAATLYKIATESDGFPEELKRVSLGVTVVNNRFPWTKENIKTYLKDGETDVGEKNNDFLGLDKSFGTLLGKDENKKFYIYYWLEKLDDYFQQNLKWTSAKTAIENFVSNGKCALTGDNSFGLGQIKREGKEKEIFEILKKINEIVTIKTLIIKDADDNFKTIPDEIKKLINLKEVDFSENAKLTIAGESDKDSTTYGWIIKNVTKRNFEGTEMATEAEAAITAAQTEINKLDEGDPKTNLNAKLKTNDGSPEKIKFSDPKKAEKVAGKIEGEATAAKTVEDLGAAAGEATSKINAAKSAIGEVEKDGNKNTLEDKFTESGDHKIKQDEAKALLKDANTALAAAETAFNQSTPNYGTAKTSADTAANKAGEALKKANEVLTAAKGFIENFKAAEEAADEADKLKGDAETKKGEAETAADAAETAKNDANNANKNENEKKTAAGKAVKEAEKALKLIIKAEELIGKVEEQKNLALKEAGKVGKDNTTKVDGLKEKAEAAKKKAEAALTAAEGLKTDLETAKTKAENAKNDETVKKLTGGDIKEKFENLVKKTKENLQKMRRGATYTPTTETKRTFSEYLKNELSDEEKNLIKNVARGRESAVNKVNLLKKNKNIKKILNQDEFKKIKKAKDIMEILKEASK